MASGGPRSAGADRLRDLSAGITAGAFSLTFEKGSRMSASRRQALLAVALIILVVAFLALRPQYESGLSSSDPPVQP